MRKTPLIIGISVVVVLAAGIALLFLFPESVPDPTPNPEVQRSARGDLFTEQQDNVVSIKFTPSDGMAYTLEREPENGDIRLSAPDAIFGGDLYVMDNIMSQATRLTYLTQVTEEADDSQLAAFGLNEPEMKIRVELADGTAVELAVGGLSATSQSRYARLQGSREVFLLNGHQSLMLTLGINDVYDLSFFPYMDYDDEDSAVNSVDSVLIESRDSTIEIRKRDEDDTGLALLGSTYYQLIQPIAANCNDYIVQSIIMENIVHILPSQIIAVHPADLSEYGLDTPDRISVETETWSGTLLIGNRSTEYDGRYVMIDGFDAVLIDMAGDYSFLNVTVAQLRSSLMWIYNIADVESVVFVIDGAVRELRIEHGEENSVRGWLDDVEISETNTRRLYIGALMISQAGDTDSGIPRGGVPAYSVTMRFTDGGLATLELYALNDTQFLIVIDGESTGFFTTRMLLREDVLRRFEILDAGGDIP